METKLPQIIWCDQALRDKKLKKSRENYLLSGLVKTLEQIRKEAGNQANAFYAYWDEDKQQASFYTIFGCAPIVLDKNALLRFVTDKKLDEGALYAALRERQSRWSSSTGLAAIAIPGMPLGLGLSMGITFLTPFINLTTFIVFSGLISAILIAFGCGLIAMGYQYVLTDVNNSYGMRTALAMGGIMVGLGMGAMIGSVIPGIGTLIGAAIGAILGLMGSMPAVYYDYQKKVSNVDLTQNVSEMIEVQTLKEGPKLGEPVVTVKVRHDNGKFNYHTFTLQELETSQVKADPSNSRCRIKMFEPKTGSKITLKAKTPEELLELHQTYEIKRTQRF